MEVNEDVKALNCDKYGGPNAWKCIDCLHIPEDVYDSFSSDMALRWFCDSCRDQVMSDKNPIEDQDTGMSIMFQKLLDKLTNIKNILAG